MKKIKITTDSTSDLSQELLQKYQIDVVPLHIHLGEQEYLDGVNITPDQIYNWSDAHKETPRTSTVSMGEALDFIEKALREAEKVICFCISQEMSSCYSVLNMAVEDMEVRDKVFIIDSRNLSTGIGLQILEAVRLAEAGMEAEEIVQCILKIQPFVRASFVVDTLTYLHRGGRCSGVAVMAGSALKLHPYIAVSDGKMQPGKKYRGKMSKVLSDYVTDLMPQLQNAKKEDVFITHSGCDDSTIQAVKEQIEKLDYFENIHITRAGSVISSHCGPGTLGVLFIQGS